MWRGQCQASHHIEVVVHSNQSKWNVISCFFVFNSSCSVLAPAAAAAAATTKIVNANEMICKTRILFAFLADESNFKFLNIFFRSPSLFMMWLRGIRALVTGEGRVEQSMPKINAKAYSVHATIRKCHKHYYWQRTEERSRRQCSRIAHPVRYKLSATIGPRCTSRRPSTDDNKQYSAPIGNLIHDMIYVACKLGPESDDDGEDDGKKENK